VNDEAIDVSKARALRFHSWIRLRLPRRVTGGNCICFFKAVLPPLNANSLR
jgi:hypothetical protein